MNSSEQNIGAVILAGGKASRMNHVDKGLIEIKGVKIVERLINAFETVTENIMIISNNNSYDYLGLPVFSDIYKNKGPIGGVHCALSFSEAKSNIVVGCDMPFLSAGLFQYLIEKRDDSLVNVIVHNDHLEPLCSIYNNDCLAVIEERVHTDQLKMMEALEELNYNGVRITSDMPFYHNKLFTNINSLEDLEFINNES